MLCSLSDFFLFFRQKTSNLREKRQICVKKRQKTSKPIFFIAKKLERNTLWVIWRFLTLIWRFLTVFYPSFMYQKMSFKPWRQLSETFFLIWRILTVFWRKFDVFLRWFDVFWCFLTDLHRLLFSSTVFF